jgi:hypothetical protein
MKSSSHELSEIGLLLGEATSNCVGHFDDFDFMFCPVTEIRSLILLPVLGWEMRLNVRAG